MTPYLNDLKMSYIDRIIKYLAGDLSKEEASSFKKELESNDALRESFDLHAAAFELIRHQLQKRDEEAFRAELQNIVNQQASGDPVPRSGFRVRWYIAVSVACLLAVLLILLPVHPGRKRMLSRYFHPEKDPVVLALNQETRGTPEPGIVAYKNGKYGRSMELLSERLEETEYSERILLYCLLASMELDRQQEVLEKIPPDDASPQNLLDRSLTWYVALALLKSDRKQEALEKLHLLTEQEGAYQLEAMKLEKILLK